MLDNIPVGAVHPLCDDENYTTLQSIIYPEQGISTEDDLYFRLGGSIGYSETGKYLEFGSTGKVSFDTWFNFFNIGKWNKYCNLDNLFLKINGTGKFEVRVTVCIPDRSNEIIVNEIVSLNSENGNTARFDLLNIAKFSNKSLVWFELRSLGDHGTFYQAAWQTRQQPVRIPNLMLSITTFRREDAVRDTVRRFEDYLSKSEFGNFINLLVVDNGKSAEIGNSTHVTAIENENLGGSGGFARGLIEARRTHASHCLFMDDDAATHTGSIERTWMFLAYAVDPKTAVSGAMTNAAFRWCLWEYGATFNKSCHPIGLGTDLRDLGQIARLEFESTEDQPSHLYGGWWYFAFPVDKVTYDPFPFFVRGDDISFSLANKFNIVRLNGVVCFQDADFADKESLQTLYLDLRNHIIHHLTQPDLELGKTRILRIPAWFFYRSLVQLHYETLSSLNLALADVIRGPKFFADNADMAERRKKIGTFRHDEVLRVEDEPRKADRRHFNPDVAWKRRLMIVTANGHFIPFFKVFGDRVTIRTNERGQLHKVWGAAQVTTVDKKTGKSFTMVHSKWRAFKQINEFLVLMTNFWLHYDKIKEEWRSGYGKLASEEFWLKKMNMDATIEGK